MSRYSINGYIIALRSRTTHTVCVEGKNDHTAVKHCLMKMCGMRDHLNGKYVIDTMDIIESDTAVYGNKDKLIRICRKMIGTGYEHKISALVDREYDCFDIADEEVDKRPCHHIENDILFFTRGHSLENYLFDADYIISFIEFNFPTKIVGNHRTLIQECWPIMLQFIAALTISIHEYNCCTRTRGLFKMDDWRYANEGKIEIDRDSVTTSLLSRGISITDVNSILSRAIMLIPIFEKKDNIARWISHGHVGMDLICGAVARILSICGVDEETCNDLHGHKETRLKFLIEEWMRNADESEALFPVTFFHRIMSTISTDS